MVSLEFDPRSEKQTVTGSEDSKSSVHPGVLEAYSAPSRLMKQADGSCASGRIGDGVAKIDKLELEIIKELKQDAGGGSLFDKITQFSGDKKQIDKDSLSKYLDAYDKADSSGAKDNKLGSEDDRKLAQMLHDKWDMPIVTALRDHAEYNPNIEYFRMPPPLGITADSLSKVNDELQAREDKSGKELVRWAEDGGPTRVRIDANSVPTSDGGWGDPGFMPRRDANGDGGWRDPGFMPRRDANGDGGWRDPGFAPISDSNGPWDGRGSDWSPRPGISWRGAQNRDGNYYASSSGDNIDPGFSVTVSRDNVDQGIYAKSSGDNIDRGIYAKSSGDSIDPGFASKSNAANYDFAKRVNAQQATDTSNDPPQA